METHDAIRLLVIDDKSDDLTALTAVVREILPEIVVVAAANGLHWIDLAVAESPDVILLASAMSGVDGFEMCRRLKADARLQEIPVLFVTSSRHDSAGWIRALEVGAEGFLLRSLEPSELATQLRVMARLRAARRGERTAMEQLEALVAERTRALRASESRYRALFENMATASCVDEIVLENGRAADYRILDVNPAFERITGIRRQDAIGALASKLYGMERAPFLDVYSRVAETGEAAEFESWFEPVQKHLHITVARPEPGFFSTVFSDVTERKRAEEALKASYALLQIAGETARFGGWSVDLSSNVCTWSDAVAEIHEAPHGYAPPVEEGIRFYAPEWRDKITSVFTACAREGIPYDEDMEIITLKGNWVWVRTIGRPVRDHSGRIVGVRGAFQDITDRKRAEAALAAEHRNLRVLIDSTPAAILIIDEAEVVVAVNHEAASLFGHSATGSVTQLRCGDLAACVHRHDDSRGCGFGPSCLHCEVNAALKQALGGHTTRNLETGLEVVRNGCSAKRFFLLGAAPLTTSLGRGATLALQDVTTLKEALAERERLQVSLAQSDRLASMGTLAAGVAHEINNPLSYVIYNVESVAEDLPRIACGFRRCHDALSRNLGCQEAARVLDGFSPAAVMEDAVKRLREAVDGAARIKDIVRALSTFARVDRDETMPIQLQPVIDQALSMAFNQIKYRARLVKDYSPTPPVLASDGKLAQVFLNLFVNAAHAIDEGHVDDNEIRVRTWADGETVYAEVSDTGRGIAPEHLDRIFEPFFTTKEVGVGSGLGLSIVRNIVSGFGGEISVSSEPGKGARFLVRLPRLPRDWQASEKCLFEEPQPSSAPRGRILVIDDEQAIRAVIVKMLERKHDVVTAASGEEAREILRQDMRFDLIFCDLMMPRISGMELHAWLAEQDAALAARVVFITGGAFTPGAAEYLSRVGNLRIEKPLDSVSFKRLTDELVVASKARSTSPS